MAKNQMKKCLWILDVIYRTGGISYKDIADRWDEEHGKDGMGKMSNSSFREYITLLEDIFDIKIECKAYDGYKYRITSGHDLEGRNARNRLLKAFAVNNILSGNRMLEGRVIYEDIPSGEKHLIPLLEAMRLNREVEVVHVPFYRSEEKLHLVEPYAVKVDQRRWYLLARNPETGAFYHLALDRMRSVKMTDREFILDPAFEIDAYYAAAFGVIIGEEEYDIEYVKVKVYGEYHRVDYLRTLPLHRSQKEVETGDGYAVFEYRLRPTDDFLSAVLSMGGDAEVLEPVWFREYVRDELERALWRYGG